MATGYRRRIDGRARFAASIFLFHVNDRSAHLRRHQRWRELDTASLKARHQKLNAASIIDLAPLYRRGSGSVEPRSRPSKRNERARLHQIDAMLAAARAKSAVAIYGQHAIKRGQAAPAYFVLRRLIAVKRYPLC